jgi:TIR domain
MAKPVLRRNIFVSYSHADQAWLERLKIHLAPYLRGEELYLWDDSKIVPGTNWELEIRRALVRARIAVLLVSPTFLASDYVTRVELPAILERANKDLAVLWVPVVASSYQATPLRSIQAAHDPKRPLSKLTRPKQDEALVAIAKRIASTMNVSAVGNALKLVDAFAPEVIAFVKGQPEPKVKKKYSLYAEQVSNVVNLVDPGGTHKLIDADDLERLPSNSQKLIRSYERTMNELFERWTELKPKRIAADPDIRSEAIATSDMVRRQLCNELTELLDFIETLGMKLRDHYAEVRFICRG